MTSLYIFNPHLLEMVKRLLRHFYPQYAPAVAPRGSFFTGLTTALPQVTRSLG